jgi:hypothetical protein
MVPGGLFAFAWYPLPQLGDAADVAAVSGPRQLRRRMRAPGVDNARRDQRQPAEEAGEVRDGVVVGLDRARGVGAEALDQGQLPPQLGRPREVPRREVSGDTAPL